LSPDNLRTRCNSCPGAKTMRESVNPKRNVEHPQTRFGGSDGAVSLVARRQQNGSVP
jgi:hypothetical protein